MSTTVSAGVRRGTFNCLQRDLENKGGLLRRFVTKSLESGGTERSERRTRASGTCTAQLSEGEEGGRGDMHTTRLDTFMSEKFSCMTWSIFWRAIGGLAQMYLHRTGTT